MTRRKLALVAAIAATLSGGGAPVSAGTAEIADWTVDGPIDRTSTTIPLLVTERACNSGEAAEGRIQPLVELSEAGITVTITVVPRPGDHDCPSNPATPFLLELPEPLGDRALLDGGAEPPLVIVPESPFTTPVVSPADATARVIASDHRFAGVGPLQPDLIGQSSWYEAFETGDGFLVTITIGWGDCPAGCIERHTWQFEVSRDGVVDAPVEGGDPIPVDMIFPTGDGDAPVDIALVAGPVCPVETTPPDPDCAPRLMVGATIVVRDATGAEVARLTTGDDGHAHGVLPTGTYVFEPQPFEGLMGTPGALAVSVLGPAGISLSFAYDTGIR